MTERDGYLRLSEVCRRLKLTHNSRELFRILLQREHDNRCKIMVTIGKRKRGERGVRYRVTMKSMRKFCPELFARPKGDIQRAVNANLRDMKRRASDQINSLVERAVSARIAEIDSKVELLMRSLEDAGLKIDRGAP